MPDAMIESASPRAPRRTVKTVIAVLLASALAVAAPLLGVTAASAAPLTEGGITSANVTKTSYGYNETVRVDFTWTAPATAAGGDTFVLQLPPALQAASTTGFALLAPDGAVVANAVWSGKQVVFTLTDYVNTHDEVVGDGFLTAQWDKSVISRDGGPVDLDFGFGPQTVQVGPDPATGPVADSRPGFKAGRFTDATESALTWSVRLPARTTDRPGPVTVTDTVGAGSTIQCATIRVRVGASPLDGTPRSALDPSRYTLQCSPAGFTLVLTSGIRANEFINVDYTGIITDPTAESYANRAVFTGATGPLHDNTKVVTRAAAGGAGSGIQRVTVGDYVWLDADADGLQDAEEAGIPGVTLALTGPTGAAVTDVFGTAVAPAVTDGTGKYLFPNLPLLPAGQHYTVTLDATASAAALAGLTPTIAGAGADRAVDSSTGSAESGDLTVNRASDLTLDFGFVAGGVGATECVSVGDYVWIDADRDGIQDAGEVGIPGVVLTVEGPGGAPVVLPDGSTAAPVTTDADGAYAFDCLPPLPAGQHYTVRIDTGASAGALTGLVPTTPGQGADRAVDSSTGSAESGDLTANGDSDVTLDFGYVEPLPGTVSVGDYVWLDGDADGLQDIGEFGIPGVVLVLTGPDGGTVTRVDGSEATPQTTDASGFYSFTGLPLLPAGSSYTVTIDAAASAAALDGLEPTDAGQGDDRAADSSTASAVSGDLDADGDEDLTLDFGFVDGGVGGVIVTPPGGTGGVIVGAAPGGTRLVTTGAESLQGLGAAAALLLLGGSLVLIRRLRARHTR